MDVGYCWNTTIFMYVDCNFIDWDTELESVEVVVVVSGGAVVVVGGGTVVVVVVDVVVVADGSGISVQVTVNPENSDHACTPA